ncbi:uncharacterized protein LOC124168095 [Ischnura elegans]|uniref:uncharacterized protein LOC124168095 n=1 Tax=Ischnura elegans TaxID=197161 RepID=UPI001ED8AE89|nr:uncharacterized protein LOC124168095 [Ischnura elegans]
MPGAALSLKDKIDIIELIEDKGCSLAHVLRLYGCGKSMVYTTLKHKAAIRARYAYVTKKLEEAASRSTPSLNSSSQNKSPGSTSLVNIPARGTSAGNESLGQVSAKGGDSWEKELINPMKLTLRELRAKAYIDLQRIIDSGCEKPVANSSQKREIRMLLWDLRNSNCQIQLSQINSKLIKELQAKQMAVYKFLFRCRLQYKSIEGISNICFSKKSRKLDRELSHSAALLFAEQFSADEQDDIANLWTMEEKIKALVINKETPKLYIILEKILALPPRSELRNLLNSFDIPPGINSILFENLTTKVEQMKNPKDKVCVLLMDEFPLKPGLQYQMEVDKIIGFEDLGSHGQSRMPASYALVFMLRGLLKNWCQPLAYYLCHKDVPLVILRRILAEVLESATKIGLTVSGIVCDPCAKNTSVLQTYIAVEAYGPFITPSGYKVVKFYDPPSLLKIFRDFFLKHHIQCKGKTAKWDHLKILFEREREEEFCLARKLTKNHLEPTEAMMKEMNLVSETISNTVASAMYIYATTDAPERIPMPWESFGTASVIRTIDNLFDSFYREQKSKENRKIHCVVSEKSTHCALWAESLDFISDWKFYDPINFKVIHTVAKDGWMNNIESCFTLRKDLLQENIKRFSLRRLNLDPMRKLFSALGDRSKGITCPQFLANLKTYLLFESLLKSSHKVLGESAEDCLLLDIRSECKNKSDGIYHKQLRSKCSDIPALDTLWAWEEPQLALFESQSLMWVSAFTARLVVSKITCGTCHSLVTNNDNSEGFVIEDKDKHLITPSDKLCRLVGSLFKFGDQIIFNSMYEKDMLDRIMKFAKERIPVDWLMSCETHGNSLMKFTLNIIIRIIIQQYCRKCNIGIKRVK